MSKEVVLKEYYTATEVARMCEVDLKTIHNWVDSRKLDGFRTPGRHLRVKRGPLVEFMSCYGFTVPAALLEPAAEDTPIAV